MNNVALLWLAFINRPWWWLMLAQAVLAGAVAAGGYYALLRPEMAQSVALRQRIALAASASEALRQRIAALPPLAQIETQLAQQAGPRAVFWPETLAAYLAAPRATPATTLLSLQQRTASSTKSVPRDGERAATTVGTETWLMIVSTNYQGLLQLVRQTIALPNTLRIQTLSVVGEGYALRVEMALISPAAAEEQSHEQSYEQGHE